MSTGKPLPVFFSNIYHNDNPTELEEEYLKLYMEATEKRDPNILLQIYRLAEKENNEKVKNLVLGLLVGMAKENTDNTGRAAMKRIQAQSTSIGGRKRKTFKRVGGKKWKRDSRKGKK